MYVYTGKGLGPTAGVLSGWTLIWSYFFIAVAGLCGFAVFSQQLITALGFDVTVSPVIFFAISAGAVLDDRLQGHPGLVDPDPLLRGRLRRLHHGVGLRHLVQARLSRGHAAGVLSGVNLRGMGLAVVVSIFSLVGFESATALGGEARNAKRTVPKAVIASLIATGAFMVFMSYVEVSGTNSYGAGWTSAPLNYLAQLYGVSSFKIPVSIGAMVSFFSLSLSCLNAGSRIIYPMARHGIFSGHLGRSHATNRTPHVAVTVYIAMIFTLPAFLMIFTNPLTAFGDAGTLAAFGFLLAYYMITLAAPMYLKKIGELQRKHVVLTVVALVASSCPPSAASTRSRLGR